MNLHAFVENAVIETLCGYGTLKNKEIVLLIDGSSTHNFI